ncbi:hypothetical protein AAVH_19824 [Aphelenchoides avenae]|nr:hypothetical protein AAVH_19824 [Aphelenchus avenae]
MNLWGKIINVLTFGRLKEYLVDPLGRIATSSILYMFVIGGCSPLIPHYTINSILGSLLYLALYGVLAGDYTNANHYSVDDE